MNENTCEYELIELCKWAMDKLIDVENKTLYFSTSEDTKWLSFSHNSVLYGEEKGRMITISERSTMDDIHDFMNQVINVAEGGYIYG
ncbi:hypothetical protein [Macrococcus animalis]|uniref:hypothetical protein n=1 Tax=Macrococcus animalis TaxID=3395467 RepID=UPI0039BE0DFE